LNAALVRIATTASEAQSGMPNFLKQLDAEGVEAVRSYVVKRANDRLGPASAK
tara:strand:- start:893 stop:1051 length:159 start_codon:yes stop_codon:yes gene_type:complete